MYITCIKSILVMSDMLTSGKYCAIDKYLEENYEHVFNRKLCFSLGSRESISTKALKNTYLILLNFCTPIKLQAYK